MAMVVVMKGVKDAPFYVVLNLQGSPARTG